MDDYELPPEFPFDPAKMKPNHFAGRVKPLKDPAGSAGFTHGIERRGAGRKPVPEPLVAKRVYLYPRHVRILRRIDKNLSAAIRKLVDAHRL